MRVRVKQRMQRMQSKCRVKQRMQNECRVTAERMQRMQRMQRMRKRVKQHMSRWGCS